jgi:hypothetical protein
MMRMSMNTALSGSGRVDDIKGHPQGEIRGLTKLVKITEDVRKFEAQQGVSEQQALQKGLQESLASLWSRAASFTLKHEHKRNEVRTAKAAAKTQGRIARGMDCGPEETTRGREGANAAQR